jgi:hypothetical protein
MIAILRPALRPHRRVSEVAGSVHLVPTTCAACASAADPDAPVPLCARHLLDAHDWVVREFGVTDLLPSPCAACGSRLGVRYPAGWLCAVCEWRYGEVPVEGDEPVRVDVVYYVRFGERIKIGTTANPRQRLGALPVDELLAFERGDRLVEHRRHEQFAHLRRGTSEWFRLGDDLTDHIRELSLGVDDPWALLDRWRGRELARRG